jgi:hypothetical protein
MIPQSSVMPGCPQQVVRHPAARNGSGIPDCRRHVKANPVSPRRGATARARSTEPVAPSASLARSAAPLVQPVHGHAYLPHRPVSRAFDLTCCAGAKSHPRCAPPVGPAGPLTDSSARCRREMEEAVLPGHGGCGQSRPPAMASYASSTQVGEGATSELVYGAPCCCRCCTGPKTEPGLGGRQRPAARSC